MTLQQSLVRPDPATQYALQVIAGDIPAGEYVIKAAERHMADLERDDIKWRPSEGERVERFFGTALRLPGDGGPAPFTLFPWQQFVIYSIFSWFLPGGNRRYQEVYIEGGKG